MTNSISNSTIHPCHPTNNPNMACAALKTLVNWLGFGNPIASSECLCYL
jgi:hypothetical protein